MTNIVLALALSAAVAGAPVPALDRIPKGKDRCELKQEATELTAACQSAPRKSASSLMQLGFLPERRGGQSSAL